VQHDFTFCNSTVSFSDLIGGRRCGLCELRILQVPTLVALVMIERADAGHAAARTAVQYSPTVQALLSSHSVPFGALMHETDARPLRIWIGAVVVRRIAARRADGSRFARHEPLPLQVSAWSHSASAGLPTPPGCLQGIRRAVAPVPVQFSATSHSPAAARHTTVLGSNASDGQKGDVPLQFSATSQSPAIPRHSTVLGLKPSPGQFPAPSQYSTSSQSPPVVAARRRPLAIVVRLAGP